MTVISVLKENFGGHAHVEKVTMDVRRGESQEGSYWASDIELRTPGWRASYAGCCQEEERALIPRRSQLKLNMTLEICDQGCSGERSRRGKQGQIAQDWRTKSSS